MGGWRDGWVDGWMCSMLHEYLRYVLTCEDGGREA